MRNLAHEPAARTHTTYVARRRSVCPQILAAASALSFCQGLSDSTARLRSGFKSDVLADLSRKGAKSTHTDTVAFMSLVDQAIAFIRAESQNERKRRQLGWLACRTTSFRGYVRSHLMPTVRINEAGQVPAPARPNRSSAPGYLMRYERTPSTFDDAILKPCFD
jgi:hypothetical protein